MAKVKRKTAEQIDVCPKCGASVNMIWMSGGERSALVEPQQVAVIFTNQAGAAGFECGAWVRHVCKNAGK